MTMTTLGTVPPHACPRCRGRLFVSRDAYGVYSTCLSCGFVREWVSRAVIDLADGLTASGRQRRRAPSHGRQQL